MPIIVTVILTMAALGKQLISNLLTDPLNKTAVKHVKGVFTDSRNYKIACRFYYHFYIKKIQYETVLTTLNDEFDLSELRIAQLIMEGRDNLKQLKDGNVDVKTLQKKYPFYNWN